MNTRRSGLEVAFAAFAHHSPCDCLGDRSGWARCGGARSHPLGGLEASCDCGEGVGVIVTRVASEIPPPVKVLLPVHYHSTFKCTTQDDVDDVQQALDKSLL